MPPLWKNKNIKMTYKKDLEETTPNINMFFPVGWPWSDFSFSLYALLCLLNALP